MTQEIIRGSENQAPRQVRYRIPAAEARSELVVKNSVFIGTVSHAADVNTAQRIIERVRSEYADASHNAWAFKIDAGPQATIGSSDDGEPGGTAGRPMLAILEGSGLREIVAVGTRYFGGVKLGTGGLVRAYGGVIREALQSLPVAECLLHRLAWIAVDYALYDHLQYLFPKYSVRVEEQAFTDKVSLLLAVPYERMECVTGIVRELTNGELDLTERWSGVRYYREGTADP